MLEVQGFILVGGASRRMGSNKALLRLDGQTFVDRIHHALGAITTEIILVGARERTGEWASIPAIPDVHVEWGALGGLHAALHNCRAQWAAVVACDLPFVTGELFARLVSLSGDFDAVVPLQLDGRRQPLCALYRTIPCRDRVETLIRAGERRPRGLLDAVRSRVVAFDEVGDLAGAGRFFINVNTPEDFAIAANASKADGGNRKED